MTETAKMWLWLIVALIDTYIIIKNDMGGNREHEQRRDLYRKKRKHKSDIA
jgi:hypothetical protein